MGDGTRNLKTKLDALTKPETAPAIALPALPLGATARVVAVDRADALGDRLAELGLTPDAHVCLLRRAPFGGPLLLRVRDYVLSLRLSEAAQVLVATATPA